MHSSRRNTDARSPIVASPPSADSALVAARTPEEPTRRRYSHRRSESLPTNKPPELQRSHHKAPRRAKLLGRHRGLLVFPYL
ncbi:hypothetical protein MRX96_010925 [Rhipicephalus microplus]